MQPSLWTATGRADGMTVIDLFAGAGGFSMGAVRAGARVLWAANHNLVAVDCHERNHPDTAHVCQDLHQATWHDVPRPDVLLASPACQGHSTARGKDRPHHDSDRSTAWAVVAAAEALRPRALLVENVPNFARWVLFPAWQQALRALGYGLSVQVISPHEIGGAQHRPRIFMLATRGRSRCTPLALPAATPQAATDIIDWDSAGWRSIEGRTRPMTERTLAQIAAGRETYGQRFLVPYYGSSRGSNPRALPVTSPIGTITTHDRYGIVNGDQYRMLSVAEAARAQGFPADYWLPADRRVAMRLVGNAVHVGVAAQLIGALAARL